MNSNFTMFAPTDAAFDKIPAEDLTAIRNNPEALKNLLQLHVVAGSIRADQIAATTSAETLSGETIAIRIEDGSVILTDELGNEATVFETDLNASNGVVHLIDTVLSPARSLGTIADVAKRAGFSTLVDAATQAGLTEALASPGPFTVFAPTNEAFTALGDAVPSDTGLLANALLHHVVSGKFDSGDVTSAESFTTLAKTSIAVDTSGDPIRIGGAELSNRLDVKASNGIIHVMNEVIVPPNVLQAAVANENLSTLVGAVSAASEAVRATLDGPGPITVFAPLDSAFAKIDPEALQALLADQDTLDRVLTYHVATSQVLAGDLSDGQVIAMASGDKLTVNVTDDGVKLSDIAGNMIRVVETDIRLLNGTVHVIDTVLDPRPNTTLGNIVEVAAEAGLFGTLLDAATTAGLADSLANDGPFTVFAPTDDAFAALGDAVPADTGLLANVLLNHVVAGTLDSGAVTSASSLTSLARTALAVDTSSTPITIGGAALSTTLDVRASNGIIHVLDEVIVPPNILQATATNPDLTTLVAAVGEASEVVSKTLEAPRPITVFAPLNSAFAKLDPAALEALLADREALNRVLTYHVAVGQVLAADLSDGQVIRMASGDKLTVSVTAGGVKLTDVAGKSVNVVTTDIRLLNGAVHLIDTVLDPNPVLGNIVEVAAATGTFGSLLEAATTAGLADTLANGGPFTLFAPTDDAFAASQSATTTRTAGGVRKVPRGAFR